MVSISASLFARRQPGPHRLNRGEGDIAAALLEIVGEPDADAARRSGFIHKAQAPCGV